MSALEKTIVLPVQERSLSHVLYAAAFIHPAIKRVRCTNGVWHFALTHDVDSGVLQRALEKLRDRYANRMAEASQPLFSLAPPQYAQGGNPVERLRAQGCIQEIHPGLFVFREPVTTLASFLDDLIVDRFARAFGAREEIYPNCIPLASLGLAEHVSSFPEHLHFLGHLREDLDLIDDFARRAKLEKDKIELEEGSMSRVGLVVNPSTCYHCYASRRGTLVQEDTAVTAITRCHRYEASNHGEFGRLLEFGLREIIFLGSPEYVRTCRERSLDLVCELASSWQLFGELIPSNDPFFTSDFAVKADYQHRMSMKIEYRMFIPNEEKSLAVLSSNLHGLTFSKAFSLKRPGGPMHTGCLGFGIERLALGIIAQHGADPNGWPAGLAQSFSDWNSA